MNTIFTLSFGRNIPNSIETVSDEQVYAFLRDVVTPSFEGFTLSHTEGFWKGIPEKSFVVSVLADAEDEAKVKAIAEKYCELFAQDAVLLYANKVENTSFVTVA